MKRILNLTLHNQSKLMIPNSKYTYLQHYWKNEICIKVSFQFCNIENLVNVSRNLAKVVEFTLEQKTFQSFPKILSKKWGIVFWKYTLKICMIKKENNTWIRKEVNLQEKRLGSKFSFKVWILARDQFLVLTKKDQKK